MTDQEKAVEHFKMLIKDYDFDNGRNHLIEFNNLYKRYIDILFVFGKNITAKFDYQMGAWFELKSRLGDVHRFYFKDQKTKDWANEKIKKATTCHCGQDNFQYSDGYPYMEKCPYNRRDFKCNPLEVNEFSKLVPNCTR